MQRLMTLLIAGTVLATPVHADPINGLQQRPCPRCADQGLLILIEDTTLSDGNRAIAYGNRGNAFGMLRRTREALADYEAAIRLDPTDPLTFYNRANVLFDLGRLREAERDYGRAIELNDTFALAYFNRGLTREKLGDLTGATDDYKIAETIDDPVAPKAKARRERLEAGAPHERAPLDPSEGHAYVRRPRGCQGESRARPAQLEAPGASC